jgi:LruC domain-containing protein
MDDSFFGTADDDSNGSSTFYTTANGLPWAIVIEDGMETVEEKNDITTAYLKFASWASSGGNSFGDWNTNSGGDYRDGTKLYTK